MLNRTLWLVLTVLWVLLAVPSAGMAMMSPMMFDAPGSDQSLTTWWLFWSVVALPCAFILGAGIPWIFYKRSWALFLFGLPLANVALVIAVIIVLSNACGGSLSCK